ncbi:MAG: hypothetical protein M1398_05195 [Deltaproteobacteria bacterium]|jgi:hypothetical protein|nr:hypothetical protein [Deltaproteobacteria bacterium]MDA8308530.1 hypothetical protein [Deltaproteobacteria bacterium]
MKKAKQRNRYEDKSDPMRGLAMQLDGDDDDIIELEDIIEMPDRPIDEEEDLDLGAEIFDVDEVLESPPARSMRKPAGSPVKERAKQVEEEDLLESFGIEADEDEMLFEPTASLSKGKPLAQKARQQIFDEEEEYADGDESILDDLLAEPLTAEARREEKPDLRARAEAAMKVAEEARPEEPPAAGSSEAAVQAEPAAPSSVSGASVSEISAAAEELIGSIESRLQEHVRAVVEAMLPGLVRSIIDEEIAKLKEELE